MNANKIEPLTFDAAKLRVKSGGNIIASNQISALKIAVMYPIRKIEIDKGKEGVPGYYWHYHINGNHGAPHIWFEGPKLFDY